MYVSDPMTDQQPLMRYFTHDKLLKLLDPTPALETWKFLDPPIKGTVIYQAPTPPEYGALWMSLPHMFRDKGEGTFPALNADDNAYCDAMAALLKLDPVEAQRKKQEFLSRESSDFRAAVRCRAQLCGVSCWYQDSVESEQMWQEYVPGGRGVIVKTTLGGLDAALGYVTPQVYNQKSRPLFATINYIDRDHFFAAQDGYYHLLALKGEGYKHEREVRLIAQSPGLVTATSDHRSPSLSTTPLCRV